MLMTDHANKAVMTTPRRTTTHTTLALRLTVVLLFATIAVAYATTLHHPAVELLIGATTCTGTIGLLYGVQTLRQNNDDPA